MLCNNVYYISSQTAIVLAYTDSLHKSPFVYRPRERERERERDVFVFCLHVVQYSDVCLIQLLILHNTVYDDPIDLCEHLLTLQWTAPHRVHQ